MNIFPVLKISSIFERYWLKRAELHNNDNNDNINRLQLLCPNWNWNVCENDRFTFSRSTKAVTDRLVITYDDYSKEGYDGCSQLDQNALYRFQLIDVQVLLKSDDIPLGQIITSYHSQHNIFEDNQMCTKFIKKNAYLAGRQLEDSRTLADYKINDRYTFPLKLRLSGVGKELLSMYEDNIWLGVDEEKQSITRSVQNEWLVSYHGTARNNCKSIAEDEINPNGLDKVSKEETGVGEYWIPVIAIIEIVLHKS
ncbi:hypothetical protein RhiirC2_785884 [Rhizophagus irregularis]|uniref:Ubiquitin-like domain-containing protein n=1 Tax=Rhizophagus irregularis TaxID=588596 RepID=A0A2N1MVH7_9GLOM|nr:hypothetical protein RhiirC2_785884 [Rhizophagus irregularis]